MPTLTVDITGQDWDAYKRRIAGFVQPFLTAGPSARANCSADGTG